MAKRYTYWCPKSGCGKKVICVSHNPKNPVYQCQKCKAIFRCKIKDLYKTKASKRN